jgi:hypothetical protein
VILRVIAGSIFAAYSFANPLSMKPSTISYSSNLSTTTTIFTTYQTTSAMPVEQFGPTISLSQARTLLSTNFSLPTSLPNNLVLQSIRGEKSSTTTQVALIYTSATLPALPNYEGASMIILALKDGTSYYPQPSGGGPVIYRNATVSGHPAWGYDPQTYAPDMGTVTWWSCGIHYTVMADLPFSVMVQIAQSMGNQSVSDFTSISRAGRGTNYRVISTVWYGAQMTPSTSTHDVAEMPTCGLYNWNTVSSGQAIGFWVGNSNTVGFAAQAGFNINMGSGCECQAGWWTDVKPA